MCVVLSGRLIERVGFRVQASGFRVLVLSGRLIEKVGFRVKDSGFRVLVFRLQGSGFRAL